ncbi:MAG: DNA/RNA helicase domain-containing protein, partial [Hylemonella sp.]
MIVYQATKSQFLHQIQNTDIGEHLQDEFQRKLGRRVGISELTSWRLSLQSMARVLLDDEIPADAGVAIEYNIPQTGKRVDFILTGRGPDRSPNVVIVELKQWESAQLTEKDGVVLTQLGRGLQETSHPSYQAWSYAALLEGFNEAVHEGGLALQPCAYLHNYKPDEVIRHDWYTPYIEKAPVFLKGEIEKQKLRDFIKRHVKYGDDVDLLYKIERGRIRPSKMLADSLLRMLKGQPEFVLIDDQKLVYEAAMTFAKHAQVDKKKVLIVEGGPGTGKSVLAINLLASLTKLGQNCRYVSKNAAPRDVYASKLTGHYRKSHISNMFMGSGALVNVESNSFDTLIVDEAHRLNEKSGLYSNLGENQIKEIIEAARCTIFFIDEDQRVTLKDIGGIDAIQSWANKSGAEIASMELASQFRCSGSDGYLAWLDNTLSVRETANPFLGKEPFDFRVFDSPTELHQVIAEKNKVNNKSRVVAGYCWKWPSKKDPVAFDIDIPEHGYRRRWNLNKDSSLWIVAPDSINEVGCIHTCQGLEVDYIGVIVGDDFVVRNGEVICHPEKRASSDKSIFGWKKLLRDHPDEGKHQLDLVIKNTYRTLMTRGMKGCYIYCTDRETAEYFRARMGHPDIVESKNPLSATPKAPNIFPFKRVDRTRLKPYRNAVLGCCRFQRHFVKVVDETGGGVWKREG